MSKMPKSQALGNFTEDAVFNALKIIAERLDPDARKVLLEKLKALHAQETAL